MLALTLRLAFPRLKLAWFLGLGIGTAIATPRWATCVAGSCGLAGADPVEDAVAEPASAQ